MPIKKGGATTTDNSTVYIIIISILSIIIITGFIAYLARFSPIVQSVTVKTEPQYRQPDKFFDIYEPPLQTSPFSDRNYGPTSDFTQMGILKQDGKILPLFGRPLSRRRDQWQYYTLSNTGSIPGIKLGLRNVKGRDLMDDTGAPELSSDDTIVVDGYDKPMQVSLYKQKQYYYI
jgi:hypothetical protein